VRRAGFGHQSPERACPPVHGKQPDDGVGAKGEVLVTDGPFTESKEWIAGYDMLEAADLDEAIEIASKHPMARFGRIELRPVWPFEE